MRSDLPKSASPGLILGTAQLVTDYGVTRPNVAVRNEENAVEFLRTARRLGISTLDTAPAYGRAEQVIGHSGLPFEIHTKVERGLTSVESLRRSLEALGRSEVDVLYIHDIDDFRARPRELDQELEVCLDNGAARVGVSVYSPDEIPLVVGCRNISVVQFPLSVLDRRFVVEIPRLLDVGVSCIIRSVFLQGALVGVQHPLPPRISHLSPYVRQFTEACKGGAVEPIEACLGWVSTISGIESIIVGAQEETELGEIVDSWHRVGVRGFDRERFERIELPSHEAVDPRNWTAL